ncbi:hypothetical protein DY000_02021708 [Brassica cretica]|uniref:Uncharacterized protein n=1 Tax=Brassica cretica TaxID=69181 RepID=A0ABQ7E8Z7_BRACR|nr:hypothetical protein DY000_02021708 [Brassica cretica]
MEGTDKEKQVGTHECGSKVLDGPAIHQTKPAAPMPGSLAEGLCPWNESIRIQAAILGHRLDLRMCLTRPMDRLR